MEYVFMKECIDKILLTNCLFSWVGMKCFKTMFFGLELFYVKFMINVLLLFIKLLILL